MRQNAASQRALLMVDLSEDLPISHIDTVQMSQVILNLVRNAFDACADSPPDRRTVSITIQGAAGPGVEMSVTDAGSGIAPTVMERLFEPFFTTKANGMGMGLSVSKTIIEAHKGKLWAEHGLQGGACFCFTVPVADAKR